MERAEDGEEALLGEVLTWGPPDLLVYTWYPGAIKRPTEVEVRFVTVGNKTQVNICHSEGSSALGEQWHPRAKIFSSSWDAVLAAYAGAAES